MGQLRQELSEERQRSQGYLQRCRLLEAQLMELMGSQTEKS